MKNIDFKKTILSNLLATVFLGVGFVLFVVGLLTVAPAISTNGQVLQHARYIAARVSQSIYICGGLLICCISVLKMKIVKKD